MWQTHKLKPYADEIKALRWEGKTNEECANIYGVSKHAMGRYCRKHNFTTNPVKTYGPLEEEDFPLIKELRESGMTLKELADKFDTTESTMSKHCIKHGVKNHPKTDMPILSYADLMNSSDAQKGETFLLRRLGYEHYVCMPLSEHQKLTGGNNG